ncbi:putative membrane protein [Bradyrhizobium sp. USDA 3240]
MTYLYAYLSTLIVFLLCDMAWLGTMASRLYRPTLGDILSTEVNLPPAIAFYLIYPIGLVVFAVLPAIRSESLAQAALSGALFGFFSYMTYDLTNQATVRNWTLQLTLLDMTWGTLLGAMSATAACLITARLAA